MSDNNDGFYIDEFTPNVHPRLVELQRQFRSAPDDNILRFRENFRFSREIPAIDREALENFNSTFGINEQKQPKILRHYRNIGPCSLSRFNEWVQDRCDYVDLWVGGSGMSNWWLYTNVEEDGTRTYWKGYNSVSGVSAGKSGFVFIQVKRNSVSDEFMKFHYENIEAQIASVIDSISFEISCSDNPEILANFARRIDHFNQERMKIGTMYLKTPLDADEPSYSLFSLDMYHHFRENVDEEMWRIAAKVRA